MTDEGVRREVQSFTATVGEMVKVRVQDIPSSGYRWVLTALPDGVVLQEARRLPLPETEFATYGGTRESDFSLWSRWAGEFTVELQLLRSFDPMAPIAHLSVHLSAQSR